MNTSPEAGVGRIWSPIGSELHPSMQSSTSPGGTTEETGQGRVLIGSS